MKIAILTPTYSQFSGIDKVVKVQARDFIKEKHDVTIFCFTSDIKPEKKIKIVQMGAPSNPTLERVYRLFFFLDRKKINKYTKILKDYDLIISHIYPMNWLGYYTKKRYGVKYIYHNHGVGITKEYSFSEKLYLYFFRFLTKLSVKNIDYSVAISKYLARCFKQETGLPTRKIVYDKIDSKMYNKKISGKAIIKKHNLGKDSVILYVGRISPHKGIHLLIKAFNIVLKDKPNAKLIVVGKHTFPKYIKQLKKLAKKNVIFTGFVSDELAPQYVAACDVYTTASLWEGFNLTIAEANAMGKPVVAFDIGPHKEVIKKGILVRARDVKKFTEAVLKLLN